jgi:hypothetical protein
MSLANQIKITNNFSIDKEEKTVVSNNMGELFIKQTKGGLVVSSITTPQKVFCDIFRIKEPVNSTSLKKKII